MVNGSIRCVSDTHSTGPQLRLRRRCEAEYARDAILVGCSTSQAQATIKTVNGNIVDIAAENGLDRPIVRFYLADDEVAENRYLLDPWDVKFEGMLDD